MIIVFGRTVLLITDFVSSNAINLPADRTKTTKI